MSILEEVNPEKEMWANRSSAIGIPIYIGNLPFFSSHPIG
jgi:hypothetical protein